MLDACKNHQANDREHMIEALVSEQFVNYFEFTGAVTDLIVEGQLVEVEKDQLFRNLQPNPSFFSPTAPYAARRTGYYTLSSENKKHVLLLEHTLPLSLREKVYASATAVLLKANLIYHITYERKFFPRQGRTGAVAPLNQ